MKSEWKRKTIGEITSYLSKGIVPKYIESDTDGAVLVLNQKCNRDYKITYKEARLHNGTAKKVPEDKLLQPGDVLINSTGTGTAGRVAQVWKIQRPTTFDGHMILIRPSDEVDPLYYGYALKSFQTAIESFAEGSTGQTEINKARLQSEIIISYPSDIKLQKRIAAILSALDDKIELNNEINRNLEQPTFPATPPHVFHN